MKILKFAATHLKRSAANTGNRTVGNPVAFVHATRRRAVQLKTYLDHRLPAL